MTRPTIYEKNPAHWDEHAKDAPSILAMAKSFTHNIDMDHALGFKNAVANWASGASKISAASERRAAEWVKARLSGFPHAPTTPSPDGDMLMVVCPPGKLDKVLRMLTLMGCEAETL